LGQQQITVTFLAEGQEQAYACFLYIRSRNCEWLTDLQAGLRGGFGRVMFYLEQCVKVSMNEKIIVGYVADDLIMVC
jgi:hypothetical protein